MKRTELKRGNSQLKKSPLNSCGETGKANISANNLIRIKARKMGLNYCELGFKGCKKGLYLTVAHRHYRNWYKGNAELLSNIDQWICACVVCHEKIEEDEELTKKMFIKLRGKENEDKIAIIRENSEKHKG